MTTEEHINLLIQRYPLLSSLSGTVQRACTLLQDSFTNRGKVLLCGNGGSAADCDHIVGELVKAFRIPRPLSPPERATLIQIGGQYGTSLAEQLQGGLPAINLAAQSAIVTAVANDIDADMIFAQQVFAYGRAGDVLIGISTSGNSTNVVNALITAKALDMSTIGLTGASGGKINPFCDLLINVPATTTAEIQEFHLPIYHTFCSAVEDHFYGHSQG